MIKEETCSEGFECSDTKLPKKCQKGTYNDLQNQTQGRSDGKIYRNNRISKTLLKSLCTINYGTNCDPSKCTSCDIGLRCDQEGLIEPETCPIGYHCKNTMEVTICQSGSYQNQTNSDFCKQCELGHWCPYSGMSTPIPCPVGTYQNEKGQSSCKTCPRWNKCLEGTNRKS